jgi:hypothetical protein
MRLTKDEEDEMMGSCLQEDVPEPGIEKMLASTGPIINPIIINRFTFGTSG